MPVSLYLADASQCDSRIGLPASRPQIGATVARTAILRHTGRLAEIHRDAGGRPLVRWVDGRGGGAPSVSISYAGARVGVAVADGGRIGIDLEPDRSVAELVAGRVMSRADLRRFERLPQHARRKAATRHWTCIEALAKADGAGVPLMLMRSRTTGLDLDGECEGLAFAIRTSKDGLVFALAADEKENLAACMDGATWLDWSEIQRSGGVHRSETM